VRPQGGEDLDPWLQRRGVGRASNRCGRVAWSLGFTLAVLTATFPASSAAAAGRPPTAARRPVTQTYHGVAVTDDYQWLEDPAAPEVQRWTRGQNLAARAHLDGLSVRPLIERRLGELHAGGTTNYFALAARPGRLFLLRFQPPGPQPVLVTLTSLTNLDSLHVVFDPATRTNGGSTAIDWFVPSPDGTRVAVSLSQNGSERGDLHLLDTETGRILEPPIPRVHGPTAGGSAAWNAEGTGIFYTRYPKPGERPDADLDFYQQVWFHRLGTPSDSDRHELGAGFPRIAEIALHASQDGRRLTAAVANGDGGQYAFHLREPDGRWRRVAGFEDQVIQAEFGRDPLYIEAGKDESLYLLSRKDAPKGRLLRLPLGSSSLAQAAVVVPEGTNVLASFRPTASGLILVRQEGGPSEISFLDRVDGTTHRLRNRGPSSIDEVVVLRGDEFVYRQVSYTEPYVWRYCNAGRDPEASVATPLAGYSPVDFGDVEVLERKVASKDGTRVPLTVLRRKGTPLDGSSPTVLTGYGGYGISQVPGFDIARRVWLDQGGTLAIAHIRGGGEYGEEWHRAGNLTRKQNVFDDFAACAEFLIRSNFTRSARLAIEGGSNGGLLMGAMLTQHPGLVRAVVSHVGIYDMLRVERDPNGAFNTTEFGSVADPGQFQALMAYSPYHHVTNGVAYPAVLMLTGDTDGRVNPAHSRKMIARLQAATASHLPVLLRTSAHSGHGIGTAFGEAVQQKADVLSFLVEQLDVPYSLVSRGPWSGAVTPTSAVIKARVVEPGLRTRLLLSRHAVPGSRDAVSAAVPQAGEDNLVAFDLKQLRPRTRYHYALEIGGRVDPGSEGEFTTFPPPGPASFRFAFASCARTGSTSDVFDRIREQEPLFFAHLGDFHYLDIRTNRIARFRAGYQSVLASPTQAGLYRHVPIAYVWDDHDFGGNASDRRASGHEAARRVYEDYVPHYPLAFSGEGPICQAWSVGRVRFILTDLRSQRDPITNRDDAAKSMMGPEQKAWFKKELLEANGKYPLICWFSSVPWIGKDGTNIYRNVGTNHFGYFHHTNLPPPPNPAFATGGVADA
jgi:prolyl oligopeptidase